MSIDCKPQDSSFSENIEALDSYLKAHFMEKSVDRSSSFDEYQEYLRNIDEMVNNKISTGMKKIMQIMVKKIVVLIEDKVKDKMNEEVSI